jgi:hypothetical protein
VELDLFGQRKSEPEAPQVPCEQSESVGKTDDELGNVTVIVVKKIHKHRHYHTPKAVGKRHWMSDADEKEQVLRIHERKLRQYGIR